MRAGFCLRVEIVVVKPVMPVRQTRDHIVAGRDAHRIGRIGILEYTALPGQPVDIGGLHKRPPAAVYEITAQLITGDQ